MKISEQWLREWVNPAVNVNELAEQMTMAGLEVDSVEPVAGDFNGVVVGEIVTIEQHPDADKLRICQVKNADSTVQVVCGAPNARLGLKAPFAKVGAVLPAEDDKEFKIKKAKLRGVESVGMLCAEKELGLSDASEGLMELPADAEVGMNLRQYLKLDDSVIDIDLTPNRADCLSVEGIARDVAVLNRCDMTPVVIEPVAAQIDDTFPVAIEAGQDCPRYAGRIIRNVDVSKPTPLWMQEKLRRAGLRPIDAVVDITNYVLLELGQPLHAFDLATLNKGIRVRHADTKEKITLLDGQELELCGGDLVIADHQSAVALAGIMGGLGSAVSSSTKDIFLESAFFAPVKIAGRARSYGMHTDASHRFERGVDPQRQVRAIERATQLLLEIVGGQPGPVTEVVSETDLPKPSVVTLRKTRIEKLLGLTMADEQVTDILTRLGMDVSETEQGWSAIAPSWRFDIAIEADLLEELARIYGYNHLPVSSVNADLTMKPRRESETGLGMIKRQLIAKGYREAITYSFIEPKLQQMICPHVDAVPLANPISADMSVMRTSLWPGLLSTAIHNLNRQQSRVRLFESGLRFIPDANGLPKQDAMLAGLITGRRMPESWSECGELVDFYDIKGDFESLLLLTGAENAVRFVRSEHPALHPGQTAAIEYNGENAGFIGALHPELQKSMDLSQVVYLFEAKISAICSTELTKFTELSKFPEVRRDLAILIDRDVEAGLVLDVVRKASGQCLQDLRLFDTYQGKGIDPKRKSLALGLTFQHSSRTLNEDEINVTIEDVVKALEQRCGATLRN